MKNIEDLKQMLTEEGIEFMCSDNTVSFPVSKIFHPDRFDEFFKGEEKSFIHRGSLDANREGIYHIEYLPIN